VETEIAAATLVALGCTRAQGFLFAKPCPAWDIESVLDHGIPKFAEKSQTTADMPDGVVEGPTVGSPAKQISCGGHGTPNALRRPPLPAGQSIQSHCSLRVQLDSANVGPLI